MKRCLLSAEVLAQCGYGVHSRQILYALSQKFDTASQALRWGENSFIIDDTPEKQFIIESIRKLYIWQQSKINPDFSVQVTVPNEWKAMVPVNIGITAGIEVDRVKPEWLIKCNEMNLVIVPSEFAKQGFERTMYQTPEGSMLRLNTPIEVVPESVDTSIFNEKETEDLDIPQITTKFNFLTVGQWGIGDIDRKNIALLIKTFKEAFSDHKDKENIGLILRINSITGSLIDEDYTLKKIKSIIKDFPEFPRVYLIHGFLSEQELARLYKDSRVKCFVSLTKGEGYGLPLLEAAACNLPIMATNWSGHLDFLNLGRWIKLPYELKEITFQNDLFQPGSRWANVDLSETKRHMLKIYDNWSIPKGWAEDLGIKVREELNIKSVENKYFDVFNKYNFMSDVDIEKKNEIVDSIFGETNLEEVVK
jgi:glycosyltransferase involved in cell wall biosynthesis